MFGIHRSGGAVYNFLAFYVISLGVSAVPIVVHPAWVKFNSFLDLKNVHMFILVMGSSTQSLAKLLTCLLFILIQYMFMSTFRNVIHCTLAHISMLL